MKRFLLTVAALFAVTALTQHGVTVTFKDFAKGVAEADVTFDPSLYPDATIIDKR